MSGSIPAKICVAAILSFFLLTAAGCCGGGSSAKSETTNFSTTLGQELSDLQKAYEQGVITEKQYREAKEKLLKERGKVQ